MEMGMEEGNLATCVVKHVFLLFLIERGGKNGRECATETFAIYLENSWQLIRNTLLPDLD